MRRASSLLALVTFALPSAALAQTAPPPVTPPTVTPAATTPPSAALTPGPTAPTVAPEPLPEPEPTPEPLPTPEPTTPSASTTTPVPEMTPASPELERRAMPVVEIHGYLRGRFELFHDFTLGWDRIPIAPGSSERAYDDATWRGSGIPWFRSPDNFSGWCNPTTDTASGTLTANPANPCASGTQLMGNMRFRLDPEFHPTEYLAIRSQIDVFDNLVMGSTPDGGFTGGLRSPFSPNNFFSSTSVAPVYGLNSLSDSIVVKRAWAEATNSTLGTVRFGRMPWHWGLGMLQNAGNGIDSDYQTTIDRLSYQGRLRPLSLFFGGSWDLISSGATSQRRAIEGGQGQTYDLSMMDNVHQFVLTAGRQVTIEDQRTALARNEVVLNGGGYAAYRTQFLGGEGVQNDRATRTGGTMVDAIEAGTLDGSSMTYGQGLARRDAFAVTMDGWFQALGRIWRVEAEVAYTRGFMYSADNSAASRRDGFYISQFGALLEAELRPIPRLRIELKMGYASGDAETEGLSYSNGTAQFNNDPFLTNFRFHPDYRIDLIFWRNIMRQVSGAYFFRPSAQYDFIADPDGNTFSGRVDVIWSRASEWISTRGNHADLGVEIDGTLRFESNHRRDAHDTRPAPGFYALLQYGVFFPLPGLAPRDDERNNTSSRVMRLDLLPAQTARAVLGIMY